MLLVFQTSDFKGSVYHNGNDCPLARCLKRYFPNKEIVVYGRTFRINKKEYLIPIKSWYNDGESWHVGNIQPLINKANGGENVEFSLNVPELV